MTTRTDPFLAAIVAEPNDDLLRLQYADALVLGDGGVPADPDRAELIRTEIELARWPCQTCGGSGWRNNPASPAFAVPPIIVCRCDTKRLTALRWRDARLLAQHGERWLDAVFPGGAPRTCLTPAVESEPDHVSFIFTGPAGPASVAGFRRGFPAVVSVGWGDWLREVPTDPCPATERLAETVLNRLPIRGADDGEVNFTLEPPLRCAWQRSRARHRRARLVGLRWTRLDAVEAREHEPEKLRRELLAEEWPGVSFSWPRQPLSTRREEHAERLERLLRYADARLRRDATPPGAL
jgi:uncharacterized protein (TIGR02996 family)